MNFDTQFAIVKLYQLTVNDKCIFYSHLKKSKYLGMHCFNQFIQKNFTATLSDAFDSSKNLIEKID